jgi:hypothetical protein
VVIIGRCGSVVLRPGSRGCRTTGVDAPDDRGGGGSELNPFGAGG